MRIAPHLVVSSFAVGLACGGAFAFVCEDDTQCSDGSRQGVCQPTGYCSFPDGACDTGQRYGQRAAPELAGQCVPPGEATVAADDSTGGGETTDSASTSGSTSSSGSATTVSSSTSSDPDGSTTDRGDSSGGEDTGEDTQGTATPTQYEVSFGERRDADMQGVTYDTFVEGNESGLNYGVHTDLHFWEWNSTATALLRFDLSSIPASATIVAAHLEVWTEGSGVLSEGIIGGYRLLEPWDEGSVDGSSGAANWEHRSQDVPWTTPGARGGSHDAAVLFELSPTQANMAYEVDLPADLVQAWIESSADNHGIALYGTVDSGVSGGTAWVVASEYWDADRRPLLTVVYEH